MLERPIFKSISAHQSEAAIEAISKMGDINEINEIGLTSLQMAAREGLIQVVLHLLNKKASVDQTTNLAHANPLVREQAGATPLYLAVENGHFLIAEILLVAGADQNATLEFAHQIHRDDVAIRLKQLSFHYDVIRALLYWGIANEGPLLELAVNQLNLNYPNHDIDEDIVGLIELASRLNKEKIVIEILKRKSLYRSELHISTAAYWAEINDNKTIHPLVCRNDNDRAIVLYQLLVNNNDDKFLNYFKSSSKRARENFALIQQKNDYDTSVDMQKKALIHFWNTRNFAKWHDASTVEHETSLISCLNIKNKELLTFILITSKIDLYEFALKLSKEEKFDKLATLIEHGWSNLGVLSATGSRGACVTRALFPDDLHLLNRIYTEINNQWTVTETLLQKLHEATPRQEIAEFLIQRETPINARIINDGMRAFLNTRLARFNIQIPQSFSHRDELEQKSLPKKITWQHCTGEPGIVKEVADYLDANEQVSMALTSQGYYRLVSTFWKGHPSNSEKLHYKLKLIDNFNTTLKSELEKKHCLNDRIKHPRGPGSNFALVTSLLFFISSTVGLYYAKDEDQKGPTMGRFTVISGISVPLLFCSLYLFIKSTFNSENRSRFNSVPINNYSNKLKKIFRELQASFGWSDSHPLTNLDNSTSVQVIQTELKKQEDLINKQLEKLKIEIVIDEEAKSPNLDQIGNDEFSEEKIPMLMKR